MLVTDPMGSEIERDGTLAAKRAAELVAMFMIGDGIVGLVQPTRHIALWRSDVAAIDAVIAPFEGRPGRRRAYGALQIAVGLALTAALRVRADAPARR